MPNIVTESTNGKGKRIYKYTTPSGVGYNVISPGNYDFDPSHLVKDTEYLNNSVIESKSERPKYLVDGKGVDSPGDAYNGARLLEWNNLTQAWEDSNLTGTGENFNKDKREERERQKAVWTKEADEQQKELNKKAKYAQYKVNQDKANKLSFDELVSDAGFDMGNLTTPDMLVKAARNENILYEDAVERINNSKWGEYNKTHPEEAKKTKDALNKYYKEIDRGAERRELFAEAKALNPNLTPEEFLAAEKDDKDGIIASAKQSIADRKAKEEEELKIKAEEEKARQEAKTARLAELGAQAETEAEKRRVSTDADKLAREFEEKYNLPIAQFWNPGWDWKKKVLLLGELLANMSANIFRGAIAGFHGQTAEPVTSPMHKYFSEALAAKNQRYQDINAEKAKSQANVERRESLMSTLSTRYKLSNKEHADISVLFEGAMPTYEEFEKVLGEHRRSEEKKKIFEEFKRMRTSYSEGSDNYARQLGNDQAQEQLKQTKLGNILQNSKEANEAITSLQAEKDRLYELYYQIDKASNNDFWQAANYVLDFVGGIETINNSTSGASSMNSQSGESSSINGGVSLSLGVIGVNGGGQKGSNYSSSSAIQNGYANGKTVDKLKKMNLKVGMENGKEFIKATEENRKALKAEIKKQIANVEELLDDAKNVRRIITDNRSIQDGIIRADGQKQWLVREDGSIIGLDPEDNVYATKNELTTEKDDGSSVIPLNQTDVVEVMNKLGYSGGTINKDFNYYLTKLQK